MKAGILGALLAAGALSGSAWAIDSYEMQIYDANTAPEGRVQAELHSNAVTAAGPDSRTALRPYQDNETLELTYGVARRVEIGQYLCSSFQHEGGYQYAGARTKVHFGFGDPARDILAAGGNVELDYMRRAFDDHPLSLELRPIVEKRIGRLDLVFDGAFEKAFNGAGPLGADFQPSGKVSCDLWSRLSPALEYYGDMGEALDMPSADRQQHFAVAAFYFHLAPRLELNVGAGLGLTAASRGEIVKSIIGWEF